MTRCWRSSHSESSSVLGSWFAMQPTNTWVASCSRGQMFDSSYSTTRGSRKTIAAGCSSRFASTSPAPLCSMSPAAKAMPTRNGRAPKAPTTTFRSHCRSNDSDTCCNHFCRRSKSKDNPRIQPRRNLGSTRENRAPGTQRVSTRESAVSRRNSIAKAPS